MQIAEMGLMGRPKGPLAPNSGGDARWAAQRSPQESLPRPIGHWGVRGADLRAPWYHMPLVFQNAAICIARLEGGGSAHSAQTPEVSQTSGVYGLFHSRR